MLFNSFEFTLFLPIVFLLYWFIFNKNGRTQNILLLLASYIFYGWWNWKLTLLLGGISTLAFLTGKGISNSQHKRFFLVFNIVIGVGILWIFKYYDFFTREFANLFAIDQQNKFLLHLLIPAGLSFYILRSLSYTIDLYKGKTYPKYGPVEVFLYISFFPQLLSGPISKSCFFLPQISSGRAFNYDQAVDGLRQFLWGLLKKLVIADNCAVYVNKIFADISAQNGSTLLIAGILYSIQIYADFSGYSDMAIGVGKLFGITSNKNFNYPYWSRNIAEFWRRWHISLTSWFVEYIYIPLGGSRVSKIKIIRNTFVIFIISGLWHGANWTFIVWGFYHAFLFIPLILTGANKKHKDAVVAYGKVLPTMKEFLSMASTFLLVMFGWILFRSENISSFYDYVRGIFSQSLFSLPYLGELTNLAITIPLIVIIEWVQRNNEHGMDISLIKSPTLRYIIYFTTVSIIFVFGGHTDSFIYFQF